MNRSVRMAFVAALALGTAALAAAAEGPAAAPRPRALLRQPRDRRRPALARRQVHRLPEALEGHAQRLGQEDGASRSTRRASSRPSPSARSRASSGAATASYILFVKDNDGDENYNVWAVDPAAAAEAGNDAPPARNLTDAKGARAIIYAVPKSDPDTIFVGLNDRDAAWHDVYKVKISTGERSSCARTPRRSPAGSSTSTGSSGSRRASPTTATPRSCASSRDGFTKVYSCTSSRRCGPARFHKDGKRVYMQTNKGDVDLTRLVLFDPATGKEELVESDPKKRVDFGGADLLRGDRRARRHDLRGRAGAHLLPRQGLGGRLQAPPGQAPGQGHLTSARAPADDRLCADHGHERHRPGRALPLRPQDEEAHAPVQVRERIPREHMAEMKPIRYPSSDGLEIPAFLTLPKGVPAKNLPAIVLPARRPVGARRLGLQTTSRSSWRTAATPCSSRTSAARPATARSS